MQTVIPLTPIKSDAFRLVEPPTDLSEEQNEQLYSAAYRATLTLAESGELSPHALAALRVQIDEQIRADIETFHGQTDFKHKVDCAPGCNYCCTIAVAAYPHEIFAMMAWMEQEYNIGTIEALELRITATDELLKGYTPDNRMAAGVLCGMNNPVDGSCMAYKAHPFPCAQYTSHDVGKCKYAHTLGHTYPVTGLGRQYDAFTAVSDGMRDAIYDAGYPVKLVEINAAVAAYFADPGAWSIWADERADPFPLAFYADRGSKWPDSVPVSEREELVLPDA
jgi:hypothetical protein